MKIVTNWTKDNDDRPTSAGYYLTLSESGLLQEIWYDPSLKMWNCYTENDVKEYKEINYSYNVIAWTDPKNIKKEFEEDIKHVTIS